MSNQQNIIKVFPKAFPTDLCNKLIKLFDNNKTRTFDSGMAKIAHDPDHLQHNPTFTNDLHYNKKIRNSKELILGWDDPHTNLLMEEITKNLDPLIVKYMKSHPQIVKELTNSYWEVGHILKYNPKEGLYDFHEDNDGEAISERVISIIVYLNDVEEGGETEFWYMNTPPVKPKKGNVLLFPSGWMHRHKGNIPISNSKYILVIWFRDKK